jgi:hypothetical protein
VALGNASLCGVGYLMLGHRRAAVGTGLITLTLLAILGGAARTLWFEIVVLVWWLALVAHGWYLAGGWPGRRRTDRSGSLIVGAAFFAVVLAAFSLLRLQVASINSQVSAATRAGDCKRAAAALDRRWAFDYLADAPGAVRRNEAGSVCTQVGAVAARLDTVVTSGDPTGLPSALQDLSSILAAKPRYERIVTRALDDFLARLPLRNPCTNKIITDNLGSYDKQDPLQGPAQATVSRLEPAALVGCGDQALASTDWTGAKALYQQALNEYPNSPLALRAFAGLVTANQEIELDHVRTVLGTDTTNTVYCSNPSAWSGDAAYRAVSPNRVLLRGDTTYVDQLPGDWVVTDVTKAVLVACMSPKEQGDVVESCPYRDEVNGNLVTVNFHKIAIPIRVIEVRTGQDVADLRVQVSGASCPSTTTGPPGDPSVLDKYVDAPDSAVSAAVRDALGPVINP